MAQRLLNGEVEYMEDRGPDVVAKLQEEIAEYQKQVHEAINRLAGQLATIRQGLRMAGGDEVTTVPLGGAPQFDPKWAAWQQKLGASTAPSRVIAAILEHGPLNRSQLRQAAEMGWSTLDAATARLKNLSLIEKIGDRWNLKG